ncbi:peptide-methionine (R)-S-oxide reductase MsrB [Shimia biformata]|uniref:peptide-methionine (R)-S-oxide reductase MsrB n=1 Tax=Shimia biformata TaxID=1294299 RepID=UPI00194F7AC9|nr:peptide-methionine (R)-S-oxide reductase MsrB [Shimia biformata]
MNRRLFLFASSAACLPFTGGRALAAPFEITRTDAEWRAMLTPLQFKVMRKEGTEKAGSSPLDKETRPGRYLCRGCDLPLYSSRHKYDSGTGWPSFWKALPNAIETKPDRTFWGVHTECHCRRCGSHLGHIFDDGPKPTGKRHCINGVSLVFVPG